MAGFWQYPVLNGQDPWAVNFFFDKMAMQINGVFMFDESMYSPGVELLAYMDPHNTLTFGVTQWDALPVNRGPPSFDEPYASEIFNTYFWPMICHTNMRRFLTPNSKHVEHQGFLAVFSGRNRHGPPRQWVDAVPRVLYQPDRTRPPPHG